MTTPEEDVEPTSPVTRIAGCALLGVVLPLFGVQALGLAGVVASANGFSRFVPSLWDQDGDGSREVVIGCPDDPCVACDFHDLGPLHVATVVSGASPCYDY